MPYFFKPHVEEFSLLLLSTRATCNNLGSKRPYLKTTYVVKGYYSRNVIKTRTTDAIYVYRGRIFKKHMNGINLSRAIEPKKHMVCHQGPESHVGRAGINTICFQMSTVDTISGHWGRIFRHQPLGVTCFQRRQLNFSTMSIQKRKKADLVVFFYFVPPQI